MATDNVYIEYADMVVIGNPSTDLGGGNNVLIYIARYNEKDRTEVEKMEKELCAVKQLEKEEDMLHERLQVATNELLQYLNQIENTGPSHHEFQDRIKALPTRIQPDYRQKQIANRAEKTRLEYGISRKQDKLRPARDCTYVLHVKLGYREILKSSRRTLPDSFVRTVFHTVRSQYHVCVVGVASGLSIILRIEDYYLSSARSNLQNIKTELRKLVPWDIDWDDLIPFECADDLESVRVGFSLPEAWNQLTSFERNVESTAIGTSKLVGGIVSMVAGSDIGESAAVKTYPAVRGVVESAKKVMDVVNPFKW